MQQNRFFSFIYKQKVVIFFLSRTKIGYHHIAELSIRTCEIIEVSDTNF